MSRGRYATPDDAAFAALQACGATSVERMVEYGGYIWHGSEGGFDYTFPITSNLHDRVYLDRKMVAEEDTIVGMYHTHGAYTQFTGVPGVFRRVPRDQTNIAADPFTFELLRDGETWGPDDLTAADVEAGNNPGFRSYMLSTAGEILYYDPVVAQHGRLAPRTPVLAIKPN